ncbi:hypothetical protein O3M35_003114 [Rhynocoris fuscipes]|uniref:Uncharacterized protein n=1 Tax=Rhynocoris fuscipes TaxID=488301 RepID=A0AAW1CLY5_9HEMI
MNRVDQILRHYVSIIIQKVVGDGLYWPHQFVYKFYHMVLIYLQLSSHGMRLHASSQLLT